MYQIISVIATVGLMQIGAIDYVRRTCKGQVNPVPATWVLMVITMALSSLMSIGNGKPLVGNIGLYSALVNTSIILAGVIVVNYKNNTLRLAFDTVQKFCLCVGGLIVVGWSFTKEHELAYTLVQLNALVAYAPTVRRLWLAPRSSEPYFLWVTVLFGNLAAIYPCYVKHDALAFIYLVRAVPSTALVIALIWRAKRRGRLADTT